LDEELIRNNLENLELKRVQRKVEQLEGTIEDFGSELLAIKRKDLKQLVNNYKSKLDNSLHGYLDIFIQTNNQLAKRELLKKFDEKALKELSEKQQVINQLEDKINKLSQQAQIEVLPPAYN
jgi:hypothetical protein